MKPTSILSRLAISASLLVGPWSTASADDNYEELAFTYRNITASTLFVTLQSVDSHYEIPADLTLPETIEQDGKTRMVTGLAGNVFKGNSRLTSVTIPPTYREMGQSAFSGCPALTAASIPGTMTRIGNSAFANCPELQTIVLSKGTEVIESGAFQNCPKLTAVSLPSTLTKVGHRAFEKTGLTDVTIWAKRPPEIDVYAFNGVWCKATLHVPSGSLPFYAVDPVWSKFSRIVESSGQEPAGNMPEMDNLTPLTSGVRIDFSDLDWARNGEFRKALHSDIWFNMLESSGDSFDNDGTLKWHSALGNGVDAATRVAIVQSGYGLFYMSRLLGAIVFRVPQGKGTVLLDAVCPGGSLDKIETGIRIEVGGDPMLNTGSVTSIPIERHNVSVPIDVKDPRGAYVYIFAENNYRKAGTGANIYGVAWLPDVDEADKPKPEIEPMSQTTTENYKLNPLFEQSDLSDIVINNVYYCLPGENSGYTSRGTLGIGRAMSDDEVDAIAAKTSDVSQLKSQGFCGLALEVPSGKSTITLQATTWGSATLKVKVGTQQVKTFSSRATLRSFTVDCNESKPTLVLVYMGTSNDGRAKDMASADGITDNTDWVELSRLQWKSNVVTDIGTPPSNAPQAIPQQNYSPDGRATNGLQRGLNIVRMSDGTVRKIVR